MMFGIRIICRFLRDDYFLIITATKTTKHFSNGFYKFADKLYVYKYLNITLKVELQRLIGLDRKLIANYLIIG